MITWILRYIPAQDLASETVPVFGFRCMDASTGTGIDTATGYRVFLSEFCALRRDIRIRCPPVQRLMGHQHNVYRH